MPAPGYLESKGDAQLSTPVRADLLALVRELARANRRGLRDEVEHALTRHVEVPPVIRSVEDVPRLPPAEVAVASGARRRRRARKS